MNIEIVEDIKEKLNVDNKYVRDVINGKINVDRKKAEKTIVMTPEVFAKIFSPEKMKLMLKIKQNNIKNIYQLSKELDRKYEAVYRDIRFLEGLGIIKVREKDSKMIPFMDEAIKIPQLAAG